jgi:hypothetical protein
MKSQVGGTIRRVALPNSSDELSSRIRKRPAGSMLKQGLPVVDVGGLSAHADYLNECRRSMSVYGAPVCCVIY